MTRALEESLKEIQVSNKNPEDVIEDVKEALKPILAQFKDKEGEIGAAIAEAVTGVHAEEGAV
jgi:DNA topoisomerase IA